MRTGRVSTNTNAIRVNPKSNGILPDPPQRELRVL
jgi:hypothetical protein